MRKQETKNKKIYRWIYLVIVLFLLSWVGFWGNNSLFQRLRMERKKNLLEQQKDRYVAENDSMLREIERYKTDPAKAEEIAREEHGLIKPGETVWRFKQAQADSLAKEKK